MRQLNDLERVSRNHPITTHTFDTASVDTVHTADIDKVCDDVHRLCHAANFGLHMARVNDLISEVRNLRSSNEALIAYINEREGRHA